jgi:predicted naringenin-chalcone synthase
MSSATILFVLKEMLKEPIKAPEDVLALAFGPGLTLESMLLKAARW